MARTSGVVTLVLVVASAIAVGVVVVRTRIAPAPDAALFKKACDGGTSSACCRLAWLTWWGSGVPRDEGRAMGVYEEACPAGE